MAVGDRTESRLVGPVTLTASDAGVGSAVPANRVWVLKQVVFCNTTGAERLAYLGIGSGTANRVIHALPIAQFDTVVWDTALVLAAGEQLYGYSDSGSAVNVVVMGWSKEV